MIRECSYTVLYIVKLRRISQEAFLSLALDQLPSFKDISAILYGNLIKFTTKYSEGHTFFFCHDSFPFQGNLYLLEQKNLFLSYNIKYLSMMFLFQQVDISKGWPVSLEDRAKTFTWKQNIYIP